MRHGSVEQIGLRARCVSGQVGLILILIMAAVGAVAVSVASRSTTGLRTQEIEVESNQAFRAAEAALEDALKLRQEGAAPVVSTTNIAGSDLSYEASYVNEGGGTTKFKTDDVLSPGEVFQIFVGGGLTGKIRLCWSSVSLAAIKISVYKDDNTVEYYAYDDNVTRRNGNKFAIPIPGNASCGTSVIFKDRADVNISSNVLFVRVMPLYEPTIIGVNPAVDLPAQGIKITALGTETTSGVSRAVELTQSNPQLPSIFDHVLFTKLPIAQ